MLKRPKKDVRRGRVGLWRLGVTMLVVAASMARGDEPTLTQAERTSDATFHPTVETRVLMRQVNLERLEAIQRLLEGTPDWARLQSQAELLAETSNLLLLRSPDHPYADRWPYYVEGFRKQANRLAEIAASHERPRARAALAGLARACNRCHAAFGVDLEITLAGRDKPGGLAAATPSRPANEQEHAAPARDAAKPAAAAAPDPARSPSLAHQRRPEPKLIPLPSERPAQPPGGGAPRLLEPPPATLPGEVQASSYEQIADPAAARADRPLVPIPVPSPAPASKPAQLPLAKASEPKPAPRSVAPPNLLSPPAPDGEQPLELEEPLAPPPQAGPATPAPSRADARLENVPLDVPRPQPRFHGRASSLPDAEILPPKPPAPPPESEPNGPT